MWADGAEREAQRALGLGGPGVDTAIGLEILPMIARRRPLRASGGSARRASTRFSGQPGAREAVHAQVFGARPAGAPEQRHLLPPLTRPQRTSNTYVEARGGGQLLL